MRYSIFNYKGGGRTFPELILFCEKVLIPPGKIPKKSNYPQEILLFMDRRY